MSNCMELIRHRRSVRTFDGERLSAENALKITECALAAGNPYNIPISYRILDAAKDGLSSPVIVGTDAYIAGKMDRVPNAEEAFGYSFEKVVLYVESLGLGTTWIAGTMDRKAFETAMELKDGEIMPCVSPLGTPAKKMSIRESMMRTGIKADKRLDFEKLFFDKDFSTSLTPDKAGSLATALEAVRLAPSAVNRQPWRAAVCGNKVHFYEKRTPGYVSADGWDMQKIDMGIALCHFDLVAQECGIKAAFEINDPGIDSGDMLYIASYVIE